LSALVVGEAPNRVGVGSSSDDVLGAPAIVRRLPGILDLERRNLLSYWPGPDPRGKGSLFPLDEARAAAEELWTYYPTSVRFVVVSARAAGAFGIKRSQYEFLQWFEHEGREVAVVPHPSGVVRWWNEKSNARRARAFIREVRRQELEENEKVGG
jgi:hypothetical protein